MNKLNTGIGQSSWITFAGGLIIVLSCISLASIILYVMIPIIDKDYEAKVISDASVNGLILSCVTLSVTLSIVVPWMMSKAQINAVAEETVKKYYDKDFSQTIQKTHDSLFKAYANDSRMIAYFLCQHNKPVWALGWVCKSSTTYDRIHGTNQRKTYSALAISNVYVLIDCILQIYHQINNSTSTLEQTLSHDNDERKYEVAIRTTRDLVKFCATIELRDKDYASVFEDKAGKDIPETLNDALNNLLKCLIKILDTYCTERKENLLDRLELKNDEEENAKTHEDYFHEIDLLCKGFSLDFVQSAFRNSASKLDSMYIQYLESLNK